MKTVQLKREKDQEWEYIGENIPLKNPLVLVLGNRFLLEDQNVYQEIKNIFPDGHIVFGSTSGEISLRNVYTKSLTITAIEFEKSSYEIRTDNSITSKLDSFKLGSNLIKKLPTKNLKFVFILSEGSFINGSDLTEGMNSVNKGNALITGGLCGDGPRFEKTLASYNENPKEGEVIAIGFYGDTIEVTSSVDGGWTPFGPERIVTKSKKNILFELDDKPALDLYKKYLGEKAKELPSSALLYPLSVQATNEEKSVVRTILNVSEEDNSMTFAGNIPENSKVQLMMTNIDKLVSATGWAANHAKSKRTNKAELAILVSCIGRRLVLDQRIEEEVEEVVEVIGNNTTVCGFYSYGEISPFIDEVACKLHNQTMTITLLSE